MAILNGTIEITIEGVENISIHGSEYYNILYKIAGENTTQQMRINPEAFYKNPEIGDRVEVNMMMGNIMGATKLV